jgi:hypothetical protein
MKGGMPCQEGRGVGGVGREVGRGVGGKCGVVWEGDRGGEWGGELGG